MLNLRFPDPGFRLRRHQGRDEIFDVLRKKWLALTPEEWVRQNLVQWLVQVHGVPAARIALERSLKVGDTRKRFDLVVYDRHFQPWLLVECKAMEVELSPQVLSQALAYHSSIQAAILLITNGHFAYAWQMENGKALMLESLPPLS